VHPFFAESDAWSTETGAAMLFYLSAPKPLTRNFWAGPYRYAAALLGSDPTLSTPGTIPLPVAAVLGERAFLHARVTRSDGRISEPFRLPADTETQAAPVPLSAVFIPAGPRPRIAITYNQLIARQPPTATNWTARFNSLQLSFLSRSIADNVLTCIWQILALQPGPNVVSYSAGTPDHRGLLNGVNVAAYANFPVS